MKIYITFTKNEKTVAAYSTYIYNYNNILFEYSDNHLFKKHIYVDTFIQKVLGIKPLEYNDITYFNLLRKLKE